LLGSIFTAKKKIGSELLGQIIQQGQNRIWPLVFVNGVRVVLGKAFSHSLLLSPDKIVELTTLAAPERTFKRPKKAPKIAPIKSRECGSCEEMEDTRLENRYRQKLSCRNLKLFFSMPWVPFLE
jgi:hypothetical protein